MAKYVAFRDQLAYEYEVDGIAEIDSVDSILKRLLRLVQCASNPAPIDGSYHLEPAKYAVLLDMCQELTAESKLIVWTGFTENVDWLTSKLATFKPVRLHGKLIYRAPPRPGGRSVHSFNEPSPDRDSWCR